MKKLFDKWISACWHWEIGNHMDCVLGNVTVDVIPEPEQLRWFAEENWDAIRSYKGRLYKSASKCLIEKAPKDIVERYLLYCSPLREELQISLINRDIEENSSLSKKYFWAFRATEHAQELIRSHLPELWPQVVIVNYGWLWKYEKKHGSLATWQKKLSENLHLLENCPISEICGVLDTIS